MYISLNLYTHRICIHVYIYTYIYILRICTSKRKMLTLSVDPKPVCLSLCPEWSLSLCFLFPRSSTSMASPTHHCKWRTAGERGMGTWVQSEWIWYEHEPHIHTDLKSNFLSAGYVWWFMFLCIPLNPSESLTLGSTLTQAFSLIKQTILSWLQTLTKQTWVHRFG